MQTVLTHKPYTVNIQNHTSAQHNNKCLFISADYVMSTIDVLSVTIVYDIKIYV